MDLWSLILEFHINTVERWQCCREVCQGFHQFTRRPQNPCRYIFPCVGTRYMQTRYGYWGKLLWTEPPRKKLAPKNPESSESEDYHYPQSESESEIEESVTPVDALSDLQGQVNRCVSLCVYTYCVHNVSLCVCSKLCLCGSNTHR